MIYKVVDKVRKIDGSNWEGVIVKGNGGGNKYITNGTYLWLATEDRMNKLQIVEKVDIVGIKKRFSYFYPYDSIIYLEE